MTGKTKRKQDYQSGVRSTQVTMLLPCCLGILRRASPKFGGGGVGTYLMFPTDGMELLSHCSGEHVQPLRTHYSSSFVCWTKEITYKVSLSDFSNDTAACSSAKDSEGEGGAELWLGSTFAHWSKPQSLMSLILNKIHTFYSSQLICQLLQSSGVISHDSSVNWFKALEWFKRQMIHL